LKAITCAAMAALSLGAAACNRVPVAQEPAAPRAAAAATFEARPDLSEDLEALPRLVGEGAAIAAINADLDRRDAAAKAGGCDGAGGYSRDVSQPMTGPGFISFRITEDIACQGAAYPSVDQSVLTYDLATGRAVDWVAAAPALRLTRGETTDMPAGYVPGLSSTALSEWYAARALASTDREQVEQCADVWSPEEEEITQFKVWLDAENGGVSVEPDYVHAVQACADIITMTTEEMRRFGLPPYMVEAVTAAHSAGFWAPKDG
jgi:hypothetical protein